MGVFAAAAELRLITDGSRGHKSQRPDAPLNPFVLVDGARQQPDDLNCLGGGKSDQCHKTDWTNVIIPFADAIPLPRKKADQ